MEPISVTFDPPTTDPERVLWESGLTEELAHAMPPETETEDFIRTCTNKIETPAPEPTATPETHPLQPRRLAVNRRERRWALRHNLTRPERLERFGVPSGVARSR